MTTNHRLIARRHLLIVAGMMSSTATPDDATRLLDILDADESVASWTIECLAEMDRGKFHAAVAQARQAELGYPVRGA